MNSSLFTPDFRSWRCSHWQAAGEREKVEQLGWTEPAKGWSPVSLLSFLLAALTVTPTPDGISVGHWFQLWTIFQEMLVAEGVHGVRNTDFHKPFFFFFFFFCFLGLHLQHIEVPRLGAELELQLPAYATATETQDPSHVCNPRSQQHQILNPLSEARDQIHVFIDTIWVYYHWATMGPPMSSVTWQLWAQTWLCYLLTRVPWEKVLCERRLLMPIP